MIDLPNLIKVQKQSYDQFLDSGSGESHIDNESLCGIQSVFPITDYDETAQRDFLSYVLEMPFGVSGCQNPDIT